MTQDISRGGAPAYDYICLTNTLYHTRDMLNGYVAVRESDAEEREQRAMLDRAWNTLVAEGYHVVRFFEVLDAEKITGAVLARMPAFETGEFSKIVALADHDDNGDAARDALMQVDYEVLFRSQSKAAHAAMGFGGELLP